MSNNRRKFLKAGTLAALAAALPIKAFGQSWKGSDGNPFDRNQDMPQNALANYNKAAFAAYLGSIFRFNAGPSTVEATLAGIEDLMPASMVPQGGAECFALHFIGGTGTLPQNTYDVDHPALGSFALFVVPGSKDNGVQNYVAIINRLPYSQLVSLPTEVAEPSRTFSPRGIEPEPNDPPVTPPERIRPSKRSGDDREIIEDLIN